MDPPCVVTVQVRMRHSGRLIQALRRRSITDMKLTRLLRPRPDSNPRRTQTPKNRTVCNLGTGRGASEEQQCRNHSYSHIANDYRGNRLQATHTGNR